MKHFKRGAGEFIGFTVTSIMLLSLLLLFITFANLMNSLTAIQSCSSSVARRLVVLNSITIARKQGKVQAKEMLASFKNIKNVKVKVKYLPGCDKWEKGSFIRVTVSGKVKTYDPFTTKRYSYSTVAMIEKNSAEQLNSDLDLNNVDMGISEMDEWLGCLEGVATELTTNHFMYDEDAKKHSLEKAKNSTKTCNDSLYISWALQDFGLLPRNTILQLTDTISGNGAATLDSSKVELKAVNNIPQSLNLEKGDICVFKKNDKYHAAVYKDTNSDGSIIWYSGWKDSTVDDNYDENKIRARKRPSYDEQPVKLIIHLIPQKVS